MSLKDIYSVFVRLGSYENLFFLIYPIRLYLRSTGFDLSFLMLRFPYRSQKYVVGKKIFATLSCLRVHMGLLHNTSAGPLR